MAYFEFARAILADEPIAVFNHGRMSRAFTCIDDTVDPLLAVLDAPPMVAACPTLRYACCTLGAVSPASPYERVIGRSWPKVRSRGPNSNDSLRCVAEAHADRFD